MSQSFAIAMQLTANGLMYGKEYSFKGVEIYAVDNSEGIKDFVVASDKGVQRFNNPIKAAVVFYNTVKDLRHE